MELTADQLRAALYDNFFRSGFKWWLFDCQFFNWMSDCLAFHDNGQTADVRIITNRRELDDDLRLSKHSKFRCRFTGADRLPTKFYYCCEWDLIQPKDIPEYAGLIWMLNGTYGIKQKIVKGAGILSYESTNDADMLEVLERSNAKMIELWRRVGQL